MVVTSRILQNDLGIDAEIADYFANQRPVPVNNFFWKNKRIYLSAGFGFLTIPIGFDLMYKAGVPKELLLDNDHVCLMESGFDKLKYYEAKLFTTEQFVNECKALLDGKVKQTKLASDLFAMLSGKPPVFFPFELTHPALARSDSFLFTLVDLEVTDEWVVSFLPYWYSAARPILLFDDFKDLEEDQRNKEENTIIDLGNDKQAVEKAFEMGMSDLEILSKLNPKLSKYLSAFLKDSLKYNHIQKLML